MFGDIAESAKQITDAFAQLNANLSKQLDKQDQIIELLKVINSYLADMNDPNRRK